MACTRRCTSNVRLGRPVERVVQRALPSTLGGVAQVRARLRIEQVGRGDVRQGLRRGHGAGVHGPGARAVEVERTELVVVLAQGEGEHRRQPLFERTRREGGEAVVEAEVGNEDGLASFVSDETRSLAQLGLESFEPHGGLVGGRDVAGLRPRRDQGDARGADRQHVDDPDHQVVQDGLNREVGDEGPREFAEDVREPPLDLHETPWRGCNNGRWDWAEDGRSNADAKCNSAVSAHTSIPPRRHVRSDVHKRVVGHRVPVARRSRWDQNVQRVADHDHRTSCPRPPTSSQKKSPRRDGTNRAQRTLCAHR